MVGWEKYLQNFFSGKLYLKYIVTFCFNSVIKVTDSFKMNSIWMDNLPHGYINALQMFNVITIRTIQFDSI